MATMSMMKKALHIGSNDTDRAARIFFDDSSRPKSRTTRRARSMLAGKSRGPRTTSDIKTTKVSKRDHAFDTKSRILFEKMLMRSSTVKTKVKTMFSVSRAFLMPVVLPSGLNRLSVCNCASAADAQKFCIISKRKHQIKWIKESICQPYRYNQEGRYSLKPSSGVH
jgi:hypothetical protein